MASAAEFLFDAPGSGRGELSASLLIKQVDGRMQAASCAGLDCLQHVLEQLLHLPYADQNGPVVAPADAATGSASCSCPSRVAQSQGTSLLCANKPPLSPVSTLRSSLFSSSFPTLASRLLQCYCLCLLLLLLRAPPPTGRTALLLVVVTASSPATCAARISPTSSRRRARGAAVGRVAHLIFARRGKEGAAPRGRRPADLPAFSSPAVKHGGGVGGYRALGSCGGGDISFPDLLLHPRFVRRRRRRRRIEQGRPLSPSRASPSPSRLELGGVQQQWTAK
jgi:hypothetical protein